MVEKDVADGRMTDFHPMIDEEVTVVAEEVVPPIPTVSTEIAEEVPEVAPVAVADMEADAEDTVPTDLVIVAVIACAVAATGLLKKTAMVAPLAVLREADQADLTNPHHPVTELVTVYLV